MPIVSRRLVVGVTSITLAAAFLVACEVTPNYLRRWANRDGSEEMFVEHLQDMDSSHEVHVAALELLVEQWDYSQGFLRQGRALREMSDANEREATIADAAPHLREIYDGGGSMRIKMRDAAYHILQAAETEEARAPYIEVLEDWLVNHWDVATSTGDCPISGTIGIDDILNELGPAAGSEHVLRVVNDGTVIEVLCINTQVRDIDWLATHEAVAAAYTARWDAGLGEETSQQRQFSFLEHFQFVARTEHMRSWLFDNIGGGELAGEQVNLMFGMLQLTAADDPSGDIPGYLGIVTNSNTIARWTAFQRVVDIQGSAGLEQALTSLPAEGPLDGWVNGAAPDGLSRAAGVLCSTSSITNLGDNGRTTFESHISDANIGARALSLKCLQTQGNEGTVALLVAAQTGLGVEPVALPAWGGQSLQGLFTETLTALGAGPPPPQ